MRKRNIQMLTESWRPPKLWPVWIPPRAAPGLGADLPSGESGSPAPGGGGPPGGGTSVGVVPAQTVRAAGIVPAPQSASMRMSVHNLLCALRRMCPFHIPSAVHVPKGNAQKNPNVRAADSFRMDTGLFRHEPVARSRPGRLKG